MTVTALSREPDSRIATDRLLRGLRAGRWSPRAWAGLLERAVRRSLRQAAAHPRALVEVSALHLVLALLGERTGRRWAAACWGLSATHLGMLEERRSIGLPNALTLLRANAPVVQSRLGRGLPLLALATDLLDGRLARARGWETRFGLHADFLADTAVWTWFVLRQERSPWARAATLAVWAVPVTAVTVSSFARGAMVDVPRSRWFRPAATVQVVLGARAAARLLSRSPRARSSGQR